MLASRDEQPLQVVQGLSGPRIPVWLPRMAPVRGNSNMPDFPHVRRLRHQLYEVPLERATALLHWKEISEKPLEAENAL